MYYNNNAEHNIKLTAKHYAVLALGIIIVFIFLFGSFRTVKAGYTGIVTHFGKVVRTTDSGLIIK